MNNQNIYFSYSIIFFALLLGFVCIGSPLITITFFIYAINAGNTGAIIFLLILYALSLLMLPFFLMILRCLVDLMKNRPAIELTPSFYIDHVEKIKLEWKDISAISILQYQNSFLKISIINNSLVYDQTKSSFWKFIFKRQEKNNGILSINLAFLRGKNKNIVTLITDYQKDIIRKNEFTEA